MSQIDRIIKSADMPKWAFLLLVSYYFMEYCRPQNSMIPALSVLRLSGLLGVMMVFIVLTKVRIWQVLKIREVKYYALFTLVLIVNIPFAVNNFHAYDKSLTYIIFLFTAIIPTIAILLANNNFERFIPAFGIVSLILAIVVFKNGGRGAGSFTWDENDAAATLCVGLAVSVGVYKLGSGAKHKIFWGLAGLVISLAIVVTSSRGGFLGLMSVIGCLLYFSGKIIKGMIFGVVFSVIGFISLPLFPGGDHYKQEIVSIFDSSDGTRNERIYSWEIAWIMYKHNPVVGVGANNYPYNVSHYEYLHPEYDPNRKSLGGRWAHSLPFTIIAETGTLGTVLYIICFYGVLRRCMKMGMENSGLDRKSSIYYQIIFTGLVGYFISSLFITTLYYPVVWHVVALYVVLELLVREKRVSNEFKN
ncbi:O-antigen ligase family protein [Simiduia agarivorans]|uniref:O-antigen ligase-related domain-containing protein n=1 Tax=Simiduia agarivorans (strain DSM 21679 / JCM 13881 / BCRC 17597 / SA1) TaxID=1117647 RepID=K4KIU4_SIMAS|nr:O-antigen ligase family protein [Simiduia agarivorans]AFU98951.2 hypothetical protein M5M_08820 [Simiduia agarivorans SA1 = DSM 21679]